MSFVKSKELEGVHMKIFLPEKVNFIINKLKENGYEAYAVGGCVRDSVLGRSFIIKNKSKNTSLFLPFLTYLVDF